MGREAYDFDSHTFRDLFRRWASSKGCTLTKAYERLGSSVSTSPPTVRAWCDGTNAPADIERVGEIAEALGLDDKGRILTEIRSRDMNKPSEPQVESLSRGYKAISDFVYMFEETDACAWKSYKIPDGSYAARYMSPEITYGRSDFVYEGSDLACMAFNWTCHVLENEWVRLGMHPIYSELGEFLDGPLCDLWNGKTDPDYMFENLPAMAADAGSGDQDEPNVHWRVRVRHEVAQGDRQQVPVTTLDSYNRQYDDQIHGERPGSIRVHAWDETVQLQLQSALSQVQHSRQLCRCH